MSFNTIASRIIEDSIVSSLYIDNKAFEPFEEKTKDNLIYFDISKGLFSSFREKNKSLDFYKFQLDKNWKNESDYIFRNRDLIVLDWQLDDTKELRQLDTLSILQEAVETDSLHFVSIYTDTKRERFPDIFYIIKAYFENRYNSDSKLIYEKILTDLDNEGFDMSFIKALGGKFKELALKPNNGDILKELKQVFQSQLKDKYKLFVESLNQLCPEATSRAWEIFGYCVNEEKENPNGKNEYGVNFLFVDDNFILINHTVVQLTNKSNPKPEDHFDFFTTALLKVCGNPLTLTSLEIRNLLRDGSGFIGKDADGINDAALYYHRGQKENFFDFIVDVWKSHTHSFVDHNSDKLESLKAVFWNEYDSNVDASAKLNDLMKDELTFHLALSKLNYFYNTLHILKTKTDRIKFGDTFVSIDQNGNPTGKFWLNITAHCDCLTPSENIKNNFYFIAGQRVELKTSLTEGDKGYNSFIKIDEKIISIKWNPRPIVLNIANSEMVDYVIKAKDGIPKDLSLKYISTLKENYTQRMANNSFAFAMRVGIDFASIQS